MTAVTAPPGPAPVVTARTGVIRVVVADDSDVLRSLVRTWLEAADGIEVLGEAGNGAEAVAAVDALRPDVVVLDVAMPVMDGLQALGELRRRFPGVAVVMLSGFSEGEVATKALELGASAYVEKSGDLDLLTAAVRRAAVGAPAPRRAPSAESVVDVPAPAEPLPAVAVPEPVRAPLRRHATGLAAVLLFPLLTALTVQGATAAELYYVVPVAVLATRYGLAGGLAAAACASVLASWSVQGADSGSSAALLARAVAYVTVAVAVGVYVVRVQRLLTARSRDAEALVAANRRLAEAAEQLRGSNVELQATNADLRQFGYVASHDLAEPLRTMSGFSRLLEAKYAGVLDATGREYLSYIAGGAARMQALIDDLRAYTAASQRELALGPVDLHAVVDDVRDALAASLAERRATVRVEGHLPPVQGDRSMLTLVVQNLVSNGIKFTRSATPTVVLRGRVEGGAVVLEVDDDGIGIPEQHRERVFALFQRLHTRDEYPGTGLGLAICQRIVQRQGGTVRVDDAPGGGARFVLALRPAAGDAT